ncbi:MAG: 2-oxoacid:acceptor oxidoreductase family protein [Oscillospiraceae bacterium]|jgi:2-oxoglutarate ferredoxin oxidoreductase subunit gamma|nr:2-oxoacid:acceptor oxidoreductase family protein [Oscillospiraceae bacterium]
MKGTNNILLAGFGGQGILFAGKFLAYMGLLSGKNVSWLPSYGPEMRGGTANCSVIISDDPVGSPIVSRPDTLIVMNLPSLDKYEDAVVPGGKIFVDSTLITRKVRRTDVEVHYIPSTKLADENEMGTLANMIITGKMVKEVGGFELGDIDKTIDKIVSARRENLKTINRKAIDLGFSYAE